MAFCLTMTTYSFENVLGKFNFTPKFRFSKKKGTAGYYMAKNKKEPSDAVKRRRSAALIALGKEKYKLFQVCIF